MNEGCESVRHTGDSGTLVWEKEAGQDVLIVSFPSLTFTLSDGVETITTDFKFVVLSGITDIAQKQFELSIVPASLDCASQCLGMIIYHLGRDRVTLDTIFPSTIDFKTEERVEIFGKGFGAPAFVFFGGRSASVLECSDHSITCASPKMRSGTSIIAVIF